MLPNYTAFEDTQSYEEAKEENRKRNSENESLSDSERSYKTFLKDVRVRRTEYDEKVDSFKKKYTAAAEVMDKNTTAAIRHIMVNHPAVTEDTWKKMIEGGDNNTLAKDLLHRPECPVSVVRRAAINNSGKLDAQAWERMRTDALTSNVSNLAVVFNDTDDYHRGEAFNRLMSAPWTDFTAKQRQKLAENLHRLPSNNNEQRIVADSLKEWANGYGDADERKRIADAFRESEVPGVPEMADKITGELAVPESMRQNQADEPRRGLFGRRKS